MKTRRLITLLILVAIIVVAGFLLFFPRLSSEPVYEGRPVNAWLDDMIGYRSGNTKYEDALHEIGPAAVPFIFRRLDREDSPLRNKYRVLWPKLPPFFQNHFPQPKPVTFQTYNASAALAACGSNAIPLVLQRLHDGNPAVRETVIRAIQSFYFLRSISTNETISTCAPALQDTDPTVRLYAAMILGQIGPSASNALPALIPLLSGDEAGRHPSERIFVHANTALAIGRFGPAASNAIPALTSLTATGDPYCRVCAAVALWHITSNENVALPIIIAELPSFNKQTKHLPIDALREMGPRAKEAFPLLVNELSLATDPYQRGVITNALRAIDSDAATKLFGETVPPQK